MSALASANSLSKSLGRVGIESCEFLTSQAGETALDSFIFSEQGARLGRAKEHEIARSMAGAIIDILANRFFLENLAKNLSFERGHCRARNVRANDGLGKIVSHDPPPFRPDRCPRSPTVEL